MTDWIWRNGKEMIRAGFRVQPGQMEGKKKIWDTFKFFEIQSNGLGVALAGWGEQCWRC